MAMAYTWCHSAAVAFESSGKLSPGVAARSGPRRSSEKKRYAVRGLRGWRAFSSARFRFTSATTCLSCFLRCTSG